MIKTIMKPFRFLKNLMRWYEREGENILTQVREEKISSNLWKKAEENFIKRGLPIPMYLNHDESTVVGVVEGIEARGDGLYVTKHNLFDKGVELVKSKEYCLPSGDFVLHYDNNHNIIDLEVFGVSLVNNEGAKDVEMVTLNKDNDTAYAGVIIKKLSKEAPEMERAEIIEALSDDEFLATLPDDLKVKLAGLVEPKEETTEEEVELSKEDKVKQILVDAGVAQEVIDSLLAVLNEEEAEQNGEEEDKKEEEKTVEQNGEEEDEKEEEADMSKFEDMIMRRENSNGSRAIPSSVKMGKTILKRNYKDMKDKAYDMALSQVVFIGGKKVEKVEMNKDRTIGDISKTLLDY